MMKKQFLSKINSIIEAQPKVCAHPLLPTRYKIKEKFSLIINNQIIEGFDNIFIDNYYDIHFLKDNINIKSINLYDVVDVSIKDSQWNINYLIFFLKQILIIIMLMIN